MNVITFGNRKGGVGKTYLATLVAGLLADSGLRVLFIDADAQGTASEKLGISGLGRDKAGALYNWLVRGYDFQDVVFRAPSEIYTATGQANLFVVPSNIETRNIAGNLTNGYELKDLLEDLEDLFEVVVIDTPPTPSLLHTVLFYATTHMVMATQCEHESVTGLQHTMADFSRNDIPIAAIVPNQFDSGTITHEEYLSMLKEKYARVITPIPTRHDIKKASTMGQLIYMYKPNSDAAKVSRRAFEEIMEGVV